MSARVVPSVWFDVHRPQRMIERSLMVYRRLWGIIVSGFFEPLFYLLSIRIGFASLVGDIEVGGRLLDYDVFVAPALMAASAMNGAVYDSTGNVFGKLRNQRTYEAVLATPMTATDVALGEIGWAVLRGLLYSTVFLLSMTVMGMVESPWALLAVPMCTVIGFAFAAIGLAGTTFMRTWADINYVNTAVLPLFLFSATFYPVASYGDWGWVVQLSPLYHGVAVVRGLTLGELDPTMVVHVVVLVAVAAVGVAVAGRRIERMLLP